MTVSGHPLGSHRASIYLCAPQLASEDFPGSCKASRQASRHLIWLLESLWGRARPLDTFKHPRWCLLGLRGRARPPGACRHPKCPLEADKSLVGPRAPADTPDALYRPCKNAQRIQTCLNTYNRFRRPVKFATGLWTPLGTTLTHNNLLESRKDSKHFQTILSVKAETISSLALTFNP